MSNYNKPTIDKIGNTGEYGVWHKNQNVYYDQEVAVVAGGIALEIVGVAHQVLAVLEIVDAYKDPDK